MNTFRLIIGILLCSTFCLAQNWQNNGFTPGQEIGYEQNGNTIWKLTHNNIYKSTNGGSTWNQNIDFANAPFYQEDYLPNNFGTFYPIFDADRSRVHGDFMFLAVRTDFSNREYWTTPDAGLTFNQFTFDADFFVETYNLGNNRYMIQVADYDNTQPSFYRCKWFYSSNGGQDFKQVLFDYGRYSRIVGQNNNSFIIHDEDKIVYHNFSNFNLTQTITLPEVCQFARVNGNTVQGVSYDVENSQTATTLTLHTSSNGGASFSSINNTKPTRFVFDYSIIDNYLFFYENGLYRYDLDNFSNPATVFPSLLTPRGPFKKTLDGQMVNTQPVVFNARFEDFNNPFYTSTNHWTTITPTQKIPYSLEAMANFATTNTRFYGNNAYSTSDGKDYFEVGDFFGSALKSDIVYLDNAMWISTYSDPSSTAYFSNDGINFKTNNEFLNTESNFPGDADFYQAGSNLIARSYTSFDPEFDISYDNGNTWSKIANSYLWGRSMFTDSKNGTLYGWQTTFTSNGNSGDVYFAKSIDNGVTWQFIDSSFSDLGFSTSVYNGAQWMAYNNHLFVRTENDLLISSDGGLTFNSVPFPNSFFDACVWIDNGTIHVDTKDEKIYTVNIDQWLGSNPAPTQDGYQVDLELSIRLEPANPAPYSDFDVILTLQNTGNFTADNISIQGPSLFSPVAVNRGDEQPTYTGNWGSNGISSIAPGESATASFPYYRLDGGEIKTNAYIRNMLQPDIDSRPGPIQDENNPEDDEAIYPAPVVNGSVISVNCPDNVYKEEGSPTGPIGGGFTGFGDVILPPPTATTTCPGGIISIEHVGTAPTFQMGSNLWLDGPGEYAIFWEITDACGKTETCLYSAEVVIPSFQFGFTNCPNDIFIHAPSGASGLVVDYRELEFESNCPTLNTNSGISEGLPSGSFFPLGTTRVTHFVENPQCGTAECSFNVNIISSTPLTGVDLELSMTQSVENPTAFNSFTRTVTVTNTGTNVSNAIRVSIPLYEGMVFSGGEEYEASQGFYSPYGDQEWYVGGLGLGRSETIVLTYYALENITTPGYSQIINASGNDVDSQVNNGTPPTVNEDDEASTQDGQGQSPCDIDIEVTTSAASINVSGLSGAAANVTYELFYPNGSPAQSCNNLANAFNCGDFTAFGLFTEGVYVLNYSLFDENGEAVCVGTRDIPLNVGGNGGSDEITLTCPENIFIDPTPGNPTQAISWNEPTGSTTCNTGGLSITQTSGIPNGAAGFSPGGIVNVIEYTATDNCGNSRICSFEITYPQWVADAQFTSCPNDITIQASLTAGAVVTWPQPQVVTEAPCQVSFNQVAGLSSGSTFPVGTTEIIYSAFSTGGAGAGCIDSETCIFNVTVLPTLGGFTDLELNMTQSVNNPSAYNTFERTLTVTNAGTERANDILIDIPLYDGMVYSGGNEFTASQGFFNPYADEKVWDIVFLDPGATATITLRYYALQNITSPGYAQVIRNDGAPDLDSTPNNGTPPTVNEDDEASTGGGGNNEDLPDLTISNFSIPNNLPLGQLTDYTFDLNNFGTIAATNNYKIELYLSTDNTLSTNDVFIGDVNTGNTFPGTIAGVGAQVFTQFVTPGAYQLIVVVDANNNIQESNENNNITTYPVNVVTPLGGNSADISLSVYLNELDQTQYEVYSITYFVENQGNLRSDIVEVSIPQVQGAVYSGGDEYDASKGSFGVYFDDVWRLGSLEPGEEHSLTINYYKLSSGQNQHYGQVSLSDAPDPDSTPGNGVCCNAVEDDEASITTNSIAIRQANPNVDKSSFEVIGVYPNPSSGEKVFLELKTDLEAEKEIYIYDVLGRLVTTQSEKIYPGENKISLNTEAFPSGYYTVMVQDSNAKLLPTRFIIER